jgi:type VI secretion system VgrG family protein
MAGIRWVRFESAPLAGLSCEVKELDGQDEINGLFRFAVRLVVPGLAGAAGLARELLRSPATVVFEESGLDVARFHGIAAEISHAADPERDATVFSFTLVPRAWLLTQTRRSEIFLDRSIPEVLAERLTGAGLEEGRDFVLALRGAYPVREQVTQYGETDFDFFCRLCEDQGIAFFFRHEGGRDVLVLTDAQHAFEPIERPRPELHVSARRADRAAFDVTATLRRVPERALVHDDNPRAPRLDLLASQPTAKDAASGSWIEYGVHARTPDEAAHLARVRAEEIGATHHVISGKSTEMALRAGATCALIDDVTGDEREILVTRVVIRAHLEGEADSAGERTWHNVFTAIPKDVPYRPPRRTPKPKIPGLVHAVIDGAINGPYAELDEDGQYKVRYGHDLSGRSDLLASRPVRMIQPHAGATYGMHFPLRPGTWVLIAYIEGDPDHPVMLGAGPNTETPSPVERANQTQNVLRTGSRNELVMEDLHGQERIRLHSPRERATLQLGAAEEPEEGALTATDASITAASRRSINEATDRRVLLCATSSALAGDSAVLLAGVEGLIPATAAGMQRISGVEQHRGAIVESLERMAGPPAGGEPLEAERAAPDPPDARPAGGGKGARLWSDLLAGLAARAHEVAARAVAALASAADAWLDATLGRLSGQPLGKPGRPSAILGSPETVAIFGRDTALVSGDRAAALSSEDTASVVGGSLAQLKSPQHVEVAGGREARLTSAGVAGVEARAVCIAGGYFPKREAPPLSGATSVGVLARRELALTSEEECVLVCADKNVVVTAHTDSIRLKASRSLEATAGSITASGGPIRVTSTATIDVHANGSITVEADGDVHVKAAGAVKVEAPAVEVLAGATTIHGPVTVLGPATVLGDLTVGGTINGKRL